MDLIKMNVTKFLRFKKLIIGVVFFSFAGQLVFGQSSSSVGFTKREIAFFKWGNGDKEIGRKIETREDYEKKYKTFDKKTGLPEPTPILSVSEKNKIVRFWGPTQLKLDGNDNVYLSDTINKRIFLVSPDGTTIRPVYSESGGYFDVDEVGDIFKNYYKRDDSGFICIHPDGRQDIYKNFDLSHVDNGIAYDQKKNQTIKIYDNGNKPEKLPVHRIDFKEIYSPAFTGLIIDARKINKHLQKINRRVDVDKIRVKFEERKGLGTEKKFLGVDDNGNSYILYRFYKKIFHADHNQTLEVCVVVYSPNGLILFRLPVDIDPYESPGFDHLLAINIRGDIFHAWESGDGVHIYKWIKN